MLRGYRGIVCAAFGWLTLVSLAPPPQGQIEQNSGDQRQASPRDAPTPRPDQQATQPPIKDQGCPKGQPNRQSDLCAQWQAADAAAEAAVWARETYYITVLGTGAVIAALVLALWSNRIALRAVELDSRPWLLPRSISFVKFGRTASGDKGFAIFSVSLLNSGRTAATNISVGVHFLSDPLDMNGLWEKMAMATVSANDVPPGIEGQADCAANFPICEADGEFAGNWLAIRTEYFAPGHRKRRQVWQIWKIAESFFHSTGQGDARYCLDSGDMPLAKVAFSMRNT